MLVRQINTLTLSVFAMKIHDAEKIVGYMRMINLCLGLVRFTLFTDIFLLFLLYFDINKFDFRGRVQMTSA